MKKRKKFPTVALSALIGAGIGFAMAELLVRTLPRHFHPAVWTFPALAAIFLLAPALHEFGHVVAGWACGFRFYFLVVGPLWIEHTGGKLKLKINKSASLWGGVAACAPVNVPANLRAKMALYAAGGPLFSLLGALAIWPSVALVEKAPNAALVGIAFGVINAALAAVTLVPMRVAGFVSDGGRLAMLFRKTEEGDRWMAMGPLGGISMVARPRDWPGELVERLGDGDGPDGTSVCWLKHLFFADRREMDTARVWLEKALEKEASASKLLRAAVYSSAAYFYARAGRDAVVVRDYYNRAVQLKTRDEKALRLATAAVLKAEGRLAEARAEMERALTELAEKPASIADSIREQIAELQAC